VPSPVTIIDVAARAGVSKTTASDALSSSGRVSAATREKVWAAARELQYVPNSTARNLRRGRSGSIGLYMPSAVTGMQYYMEFAFGAVEQAMAEHLDVTLLAPDSPAHRIGRTLDGVIVVDPIRDSARVEELLRLDLPVVAAERYRGSAPEPAGTVTAEHGKALEALLDHLHAQGARHPALISPDTSSDWSAQLDRAFRAWCRRRDVARVHARAGFAAGADELREITRRLLHGDAAIDAVVCGPDGSALGVVAAARDLGIEVGQDLLVASCVDSPAMELASPAITSIDLRPRAFGRACAELMTRLLGDGDTAPRTIRFPVELRIRASTTRAASPDAQRTPHE
jgi:DNA-binding LacI/PurR family transcriptional regulator